MNAYEMISLALPPYVLGIIPEQVLFAVMLRARYNTKNSCQHTSVFCIRCCTHHEAQVINEQLSSSAFLALFPYYFATIYIIYIFTVTVSYGRIYSVCQTQRI